jgi:hypothetical protein
MGLIKVAKELLSDVTTKVAWVLGLKVIHSNEAAGMFSKRVPGLSRPSETALQ